MDNHFYGTVIMRDTVHYLEPHRRKSRDMHILGNGRKTLLHRHNHLQPHLNYTEDHANSQTPQHLYIIKYLRYFLKRFSRYNFDGFCLGILFTNRIFNELVLGLSWRGNPLTKGVGGICQSRVRMKSDNNAYSFNALFISLKSSQEHRIPLRMGVLNLVHELLHSFGARHDPEPAQNPSCVPKDKWINGRYLMSKYSNDGHKLNHEILSPCTEMAVIENLKSHHRTKCLTLHTKSICGDGIVQNEECDCGTTFQCVAAKSCCIPHEGFKNSEACTLHKVKLDNCTLSNVAETSYIQIKTPHPKNQRIIY
ncbi:ADAM10 [Lepeophtheirus salmonis]|uniref:ADAM10 n=1 Tax=Lepeophtheirus salmonis TaxID=72036 RepID=A0A7R8H529_LEPSM|nr:ADAM10 [Lepeophtheirus salmonis]CAF2869147.1 ADAM10 [Lepeophtheirus salmonis]